MEAGSDDELELKHIWARGMPRTPNQPMGLAQSCAMIVDAPRLKKTTLTIFVVRTEQNFDKSRKYVREGYVYMQELNVAMLRNGQSKFRGFWTLLGS